MDRQPAAPVVGLLVRSAAVVLRNLRPVLQSGGPRLDHGDGAEAVGEEEAVRLLPFWLLRATCKHRSARLIVMALDPCRDTQSARVECKRCNLMLEWEVSEFGLYEATGGSYVFRSKVDGASG